MKLFYDSEFTGLQKNTSLISVGFITETNEIFYAEFNDYDKSQVNEWINEHVIKNCKWVNKKDQKSFIQKSADSVECFGNKEFIKKHLIEWLNQFDNIELWSDCLPYDWVLFCDIFGGAFDIPKNVYYIPFDISTLMKMKGVDPDINREEFAQLSNGEQKHNSLWDAKVIKRCYEKLNIK